MFAGGGDSDKGGGCMFKIPELLSSPDSDD